MHKCTDVYREHVIDLHGVFGMLIAELVLWFVHIDLT